VKLIIPGKLPTLNEIIAESKRHYGQYSSMKARHTEMVALLAKEQNIKPISQADFIITWYCWNKRKNKDNIMAGQKFIFDGLQYAGIITNDGWQQLRNVEHRFEVDKKNPRIEVIILPVEESA
jgi:hypothetical protein